MVDTESRPHLWTRNLRPFPEDTINTRLPGQPPAQIPTLTLAANSCSYSEAPPKGPHLYEDCPNHPPPLPFLRSQSPHAPPIFHWPHRSQQPAVATSPPRLCTLHGQSGVSDPWQGAWKTAGAQGMLVVKIKQDQRIPPIKTVVKTS